MNKLIISILFALAGLAFIVLTIKFPEKDKGMSDMNFRGVLWGVVLIIAGIFYYLNN